MTEPEIYVSIHSHIPGNSQSPGAGARYLQILSEHYCLIVFQADKQP